jgi:hypothetical protein
VQSLFVVPLRIAAAGDARRKSVAVTGFSPIADTPTGTPGPRQQPVAL